MGRGFPLSFDTAYDLGEAGRKPGAVMDEQLIIRFGGDRISSRQIDELIGLARGIAADGNINVKEVEFLQKWLAANIHISDNPLIRVLYARVTEVLEDGIVDDHEQTELLDTLNRFSSRDFELGEVLKATTLPLCEPAPDLTFPEQRYCFTGTFTFGKRKDCENAVVIRGAICSDLNHKTDVLVIGLYATESWKHSSFGNKIVQASEWQDAGIPICIMSESHWTKYI